MTVDEAVETLAKHFTLDTPELDAIFTIRRYVERVREVERKLQRDAEEGVNFPVDYTHECAARAADLAAAREGRDE